MVIDSGIIFKVRDSLHIPPEVRCLWEVTEGNLGTAREARSTGMRTGLGRGEGLDLDVGAVDELLVGECEV